MPGNSATVDEALAITGGSPAATMAGKLTNEPPPAMAFIAPASSPAAASKAECCMLITLGGAIAATLTLRRRPKRSGLNTD